MIKIKPPEFSETYPTQMPGFEDTTPGKMDTFKPEPRPRRPPMVLPEKSAEVVAHDMIDPTLLVDRRAVLSERAWRQQVEMEDRRFRYWVMKIIVISFCAVMFMVIGIITYTVVVQHNNVDNSSIKSFLDTLTEILKILKPPNS